jgi:hypothetical protein
MDPPSRDPGRLARQLSLKADLGFYSYRRDIALSRNSEGRGLPPTWLLANGEEAA